jgi:FkbM family methyltransferase
LKRSNPIRKSHREGLQASTRKLERDDIVWAYRLLLDREAATEEDIQRNLDAWSTRADMRRGFMSSREFREKNPGDLAYTPETTIVMKEIAPGLRLYLDLADVAIGLNVARDRYETDEIAYARSVVGRGDFVLDVGANIGFFALHLAAIVGPTGHVYAFEPLDQNAALFERSLRENGLEERVSLYRHAVGAVAGEAEIVFLSLEEGAQNSGGAYLSTASREVPTDHRLVRTRIVPLDGETFARPIRFIKVDVEGAESLVFRGARRLLSEDRPVILSEINPSQIQKVAASTPRELIAEMEEIGYECLPLENGKPGLAVRDVPDDRVRSVVFRPRPT